MLSNCSSVHYTLVSIQEIKGRRVAAGIPVFPSSLDPPACEAQAKPYVFCASGRKWPLGSPCNDTRCAYKSTRYNARSTGLNDSLLENGLCRDGLFVCYIGYVAIDGFGLTIALELGLGLSRLTSNGAVFTRDNVRPPQSWIAKPMRK
jgi:hypothetical protein